MIGGFLVERNDDMYTTEQLIEKVKNCGQSIIDNAESIVGDVRYQTDIDIYINISMDGEPPEVSATSRWIPEKEVERVW